MTTTLRLMASIAAVAALAGCFGGPAPQVRDDVIVQPGGIEALPPTAQGALAERKPDLCHAAQYTNQIGQPGSVIPTLGVSRDYRIVEYRGIEPHQYNPNRVVFRLDAAGNIAGVDCG
ncbi:MAG: hypothetical protein Q4G25_02060 [Paracoccus sp. (in: a-proteobacteria)]|nr:hypothetical protein [Paracoccus sp. (in: a-proteobacteria)]